MLNQLGLYVKYPSAAGIIAAIWIGSGIMILTDHTLPIFTMIQLNMVVSIIIAFVGFRVDKR